MSRYEDTRHHDEIVHLRGRLNHAEMQRDRFQAALQGDVLKIAKVAIYQAAIDAGKDADADTIGCMGVELDDLKAENAKLKDEVERLKGENNLLRMRAIDDPVIRRSMLEVIRERSKEGRP